MKKSIFSITRLLNAALDNEWESWHIDGKRRTKIDRFFTDGTVLCFVSNTSTLRVIESDDEIADIVKSAEEWNMIAKMVDEHNRSLEKGATP